MFRNLRIGTKLIATFILIITLAASIGLFAIWQNSRLADAAGEMSKKDIPGIHALASIDALVGSHRRAEMLMLLAQENDQREKYVQRNVETTEKMQKARAAYEQIASGEDEKKLYAEFTSAWNAYIAEYPAIVDAARKGDVGAAAPVIFGASSKAFNAAIDTLAKLEQLKIKQSEERTSKTLSISRQTAIGIGVLMAISILFGIAVGVLLSRSFSSRLSRLAADAEKVASGDLGVSVTVDSSDEVGELAASFEKMINSLREMIGHLADSATQIGSASGELHTESGRMANGAEEVAGQSITVATASEEMSATSADIANSCHMAADSALRADQAAAEGGEIVTKSINVMHRIAERVQASAKTVEELGKRSDQIGTIISTIEEIADQTNLLALNAAIEAARAGEQGKGFAVVADEVRALAERTTKATREIDAMIKAIQQETKSAVNAMEEGVAEVEQGTTEAARSGAALQRIQDEINALTLQVQQIASAAEEQTATTTQISENIQQITAIAQTTVEGARSTSNESQHLSDLAAELQKLVSQFTLSGSGKLIEWSMSYSVDVQAMDKEHQRLVDLINSLFSAMRAGRGKDAIGAVLADLIEYTKTHFAHEERLMKETGFPGYEEQRRAHEALIAKVLDIQQKYANGTALSQEVMSFLKNWLVNHIQGMDKGYGPHMNKKGVR